MFDDARPHAWTGGSPPSFEQLEARYRRRVLGQSDDGAQGWLNWILRRVADGQLVGTVQATLHRPVPEWMEPDAPGDRPGSLKLRAWDRAGNTLTQTTTRAFELKPWQSRDTGPAAR